LECAQTLAKRTRLRPHPFLAAGLLLLTGVGAGAAAVLDSDGLLYRITLCRNWNLRRQLTVEGEWNGLDRNNVPD